MNDQLNINNMNSDSDSLESTILAKVSDSVTDILTGTSIPTPIKRNAFKAFSQLCTAAIDIPVAHLEGMAAEIRAETQARIKIISTGADQIVSQMSTGPEYARAAVQKYGQKIIKEQINLDKVCEAAARQIHQESINSDIKQDEDKEVPSINDDWLNNFEREASQKSTEEMQLLFGRILAGEIQRPSSFSIKTVRLFANLDTYAANLFRHLCSLCVSLKMNNHILDARVVSLSGNAASNSLRNYGLSFDQLNVLHEYGLIIPDYNSYFDYRISIIHQDRSIALPFVYQNREWGLAPSPDQQGDKELRLSGVALSLSGKELLNIVDIEISENYTSALQEYFKNKSLQMVEIKRK